MVSVAKTSNTRVFIIEGRAGPTHKPSYESCMRLTGITQGFGDIERIECPDPNEYGKFIEVAEIRGAAERATTTLEGRYTVDLLSDLLKLARRGCSVDVQLHIGECTDPSNFNVFKKALILESAYITGYSTEDLGALTSDDNAVVNESADISAKSLYEVRPLSFAEKASAIVTNEVLDVVIADTVSCGECESESTGCQKIYAITKAAGGSPSTPADVVFSLDGGVTWYSHDIDTLGVSEDPNAIDAVGEYLVVVSNAAGALFYTPQKDVKSPGDPSWTKVTTGFVSARGPNDIYSLGTVAYIAAHGGYIYKLEDPTTGVSVLDSGSATVDNLLAIHAYSEDFIVAVGNNGAVVYSEDGSSFSAATRPVGVGVNLNAVWVKSPNEWLVGTSNGRLYYTLNKGQTWTEKPFNGSGSGRIDDIVFATDSIAFLTHATATPRARILRSYDGGYSWVVTPEDSGTLPLADRINALGYCRGEPNFVVGVGLHDNATDGIVVVGTTA